MKENSIKNERSSIEEDIKILEEMIENANIENMDMNNCFGGEHIEAIEHILSDYKRVLKENEELKEYLISQNCEINRLNLDKIRLELSQIPDTTEQYKYLKNEYKIRLERTDLENYKSNYISVQKVKDKIEELKQKAISYGPFIDKDESFNIESKISILQELLEGRK